MTSSELANVIVSKFRANNSDKQSMLKVDIS